MKCAEAAMPKKQTRVSNVLIKSPLAEATGLYWEVSRSWQGQSNNTLTTGMALGVLSLVRLGTIEGGKLEELEARLKQQIITRKS
jgi:hypothetical protein